MRAHVIIGCPITIDSGFIQKDREVSPAFLSPCCHSLMFAQRGLWRALARRHFEVTWRGRCRARKEERSERRGGGATPTPSSRPAGSYCQEEP